ncbi:MAG TPA: hypothetical protein PKX92_00730 [Edaphocola sp.]|nr:hypothetical protein [Edaphocola sp.]
MFFNCSSTINSKLSPKAVVDKLSEQKLNIKGLEFDVKPSEGLIKLIPQTENDDTSRLAPISHVSIQQDGTGSKISLKSKPRRLDLGGLYLVVGVLFLLVGIAGYLYLAYPERTTNVPLILIGAAVLAFIIFRVRLQSSYYHYIAGIRKFVRENAQ